MILTFDVEQAQMDAFARIADAALKGAGIAMLADVAAWMTIMQDAVKSTQTVTMQETE